MKTVTVGFSNFWGGNAEFDAEYLYRCFPFLRGRYDLRVSDQPDFMFYSVYGYIKKYAPNSIRILISGECGDHFSEGGKLAPGEFDPNFFHYGLTCAADNIHPNHMFMPQPYLMLNLYNDGWKSLIRDNQRIYGIAAKRPLFCNFIYGNQYSLDRIDFMKKLSFYKRVECAGPVMNNTSALRGLPSYSREGYHVKQAFQAQCKFSLAFENNYFPGYTTEKLTDPLVARSVPIYLGNPKVGEMFNRNSFIDVGAFPDWESAINYIIEIDSHPKMYEYYLNQPPFRDNQVPYQYSDEYYLHFFERIFGDHGEDTFGDVSIGGGS